MFLIGGFISSSLANATELEIYNYGVAPTHPKDSSIKATLHFEYNYEELSKTHSNAGVMKKRTKFFETPEVGYSLETELENSIILMNIYFGFGQESLMPGCYFNTNGTYQKGTKLLKNAKKIKVMLHPDEKNSTWGYPSWTDVIIED